MDSFEKIAQLQGDNKPSFEVIAEQGGTGDSFEKVAQPQGGQVPSFESFVNKYSPYVEPITTPPIKPLEPKLDFVDKAFKMLGRRAMEMILPMAQKAGIVPEGTYPLVKEPPARVEYKQFTPEWFSPEGEVGPQYNVNLIPPPSEQSFDVGSLISGFEHMDRNVKRLLSGTPEEREYALRSLVRDAAWWAPFLGPQEKGFFELMGKVAKGVTLPPRKIYQLYEKILPPGSPVQKLLAEAVRPYWEMFTLPVNKKWVYTFEKDMPWKSPKEILQPAVERLPKAEAEAFRYSEVARQNVSAFGESLKQRFAEANLSFKEREDVMEALRKWKPGTPFSRYAQTPGGRKFLVPLLAEFDTIGVKPGYRELFMKDLSKAFQSKFVSKADITPHMQEVWNKVDRALADKKDFKGIQKFFDESFGSAAFSPDEKVFLHDYYALHASTGEAIREAARSSSWKFLESDLKTKGVIQTYKAGPDYMASEVFPKVWVPRDVELELRTLKLIPRISSGVVGRYFAVPMNAWKTAKVVMRPATHFRNIFSNMILNDWGGLSFTRLDLYFNAFRDIKRAVRHGENVPEWKLWKKLTGEGSTFTTAEVDELGTGIKWHLNKHQNDVYKSNGLNFALDWFDRAAKPFRFLYNMEEQWAKYTKFKYNLHLGMDEEEAALDAMKWTFNYGEITRATALTRRTIAPFFTFQSKVLPIMAETAVKHPVRFFKWPLFYMYMQNYALGKIGMTDEEFEAFNHILPDYIRDGQMLMMPSRDSKGRLQLLNLSYMIPGWGDLNDLQTSPIAWAIGNPFLTMAAGLYDNKKFGGAPIYYDWEAPVIKAKKMSAFIWDTFQVPQLSTRWWDKLHQTYHEHPDALTWNQQATAELGFKLTPIDPHQAKRKHKALQDIHRAEAGSQLRKRLREAVTPEKRKEIRKEYRENLKRIRARD